MHTIIVRKQKLKKRVQREGVVMEKFSGKTSRLAWELFKRTGKINYYLLYSGIENSPEPTLQDFLDREDGGLER